MFIGSKKKLLDVLAETGKVQQDSVRDWRNLSDSEIEKKLRLEQMVSSEDITRSYSQIYSLPYITLKSLKISKETLVLIPEELAHKYRLIAYDFNKEKNLLKVATDKAADLSSNIHRVTDDFKKKKGIDLEIALTTPEDLDNVLNLYQKDKIVTDASPTQNIPVQNIPVTAPLSPPQVQPSDKPKTIENLEKITIPFEVISKFPEDIARKYQMVVFEAPHSSFIKVAVANPDDKKVREILDFVREKNDIAIDEYKALPGQIHRAMRFYQERPLAKDTDVVGVPEEEKHEAEETPKRFVPKPEISTIQPLSAPPSTFMPQAEKVPEVLASEEKPLQPSENDLDNFLGEEVKEAQDLQAIAESGNVPKIVAAIIALAADQKASDIHIEAEENNLRIRFRVDGILRDIIKLPLNMQPAIISRIKILSKLKIDESRIPQDGRFEVLSDKHQIDLRVSTLPTIHGEKVAMRLLDKSAHIYTLEELGLAGRSLRILTENIDKPYGIILAAGPTGSGKSTTLYAILNRISTPSINIITLEDPVEYEIPGINQCQIKPKIGFNFANGLRSVLRQDPNVIMVGEIRDAETASLANHAALTGHLVLTTLHTNDASGALPRLINMGIEPFLITSAINCILAQRLVRKLCPKCKKPAHIPEPVKKEIDQELASFNFPKPYQFSEGRGCAECDQGYHGRIGIFEVLPMSEKVESLAVSRRPASEIKQTAIEEGMVTMKQDGLIKALEGTTTVNEVLRVVSI